MDRIVLIMDTGRFVDFHTAQWFASRGDKVMFIGDIARRGAVYGGMPYLRVTPTDEAGLLAAAERIEQQYGRLDVLVIGAFLHPEDGKIGTGHDYDAFTDTLTLNVVGCRKMIEVFSPLLAKGMKRIACITDMESSNTWSTGSEDLAYHASLAAINMLGRMMFNKLRPEGFTFRWYCESREKGGMSAAEYIASSLCYDPKEPYTHSDENRFVLRDAFLREISW